MSTPKKISARNPVCMLCGNSYESLRVLRIFSKSGTSKDLCVKVHKFCGITISEEDSSAKVICRVCVAFVNKMEQFIQKALSIQNMLYEENSEYSIKRCVQLSPSLHKPWKRLSCMPSESCVNIPSTSADQPSKPVTPRRSVKQLSFSTSQVPTVLMPKSPECVISEQTSAPQAPTVIMPNVFQSAKK